MYRIKRLNNSFCPCEYDSYGLLFFTLKPRLPPLVRGGGFFGGFTAEKGGGVVVHLSRKKQTSASQRSVFFIHLIPIQTRRCTADNTVPSAQ